MSEGVVIAEVYVTEEPGVKVRLTDHLQFLADKRGPATELEMYMSAMAGLLGRAAQIVAIAADAEAKGADLDQRNRPTDNTSN